MRVSINPGEPNPGKPTKSRHPKWALSDAAKIREWENALERDSGILSSILALLDL
jgi:hypothetical protein